MDTVIFEDVLINQKLLDFYNSIKLKNPMLIGKPSQWRKQTTFDKDRNSITVMSVLEIFHSSKPDSMMGKISYWDNKYYVHSRLIRNDKFAHWNQNEYHARSSVHMKNMIKIALDNLIPLTVQEIKEVSNNRTTIFSNIADITSNVSWKVKQDINKIHNGMWYEELIHMHDVGYKPNNQEIANAILLAVANRKVFEEDFKYKPNVVFVYIQEDDSVSVVNNNDQVSEYAKLDMLPKDIFNKVMVLSVSDELTFIRDVGKKDGINKFWVLL